MQVALLMSPKAVARPGGEITFSCISLRLHVYSNNLASLMESDREISISDVDFCGFR